MIGRYDTALVLLSVGIAVVAAFAGLDLASRVAAARGRRAAPYWLAGGAAAMGTGIWAMHFIGMLAFSLPVPTSYDMPITLFSWLIAVLASGLALHTVSQHAMSRRRLVFAGPLMGTAIVAMHYLGMEAMRMQPHITYDPLLFGLSVLIAVLAASLAMWLAFMLRQESLSGGFLKKALAALTMGAAIAGMHYTGMAAARFADGSVCGAGARAFDSILMAATVGGFTLLFLMTTLMVSIFVALPPTIRSRLVFLVIGCMLPVSLMALGFVVHHFQQSQAQQVASVISTARSMSATIDRDLASVASGLAVLATTPFLEQGDLRGFRRQAQTVLMELRANAITLADAGGRQVVDTRPPDGAPLPRFADMAQARRVVESGRAVVSNRGAGSAGSAGADPVITIAVPARRRGAITHVVSATLLPDRMAQVIIRQNLPADWIVAVLDGTGGVVAALHDPARPLAQLGLSGLLARLADANEGMLETTAPEGRVVTTMFSRSPTSRWTVAIGVPSQAINAGLLRSLWWLIVILAVLLSASFTLAWAIGGSITRSVRALTGPAMALGNGMTVCVPPLGLTEADAVGKALTNASALLAVSQHAAQHDPLTGIANRSLFNESVRHALALAKRTGGNVAVLYVDLDGFKQVNDTHGHEVGDLLLKAVAARIQVRIRECDVVARLGGDEFAVALIQPGPSGAATVAGKLVEALAVPFPLSAQTLRISASIGAAVYPDSAGSFEDLLRKADEAMYDAKKNGKRRFVITAAGAP